MVGPPRARVDVYGYPTVETREANRDQLSLISRAVRERLPPSKYKNIVKATRVAVQQLCGDPGDECRGDLGSMLELFAHARGAPTTYVDCPVGRRREAPVAGTTRRWTP